MQRRNRQPPGDGEGAWAVGEQKSPPQDLAVSRSRSALRPGHARCPVRYRSLPPTDPRIFSPGRARCRYRSRPPSDPQPGRARCSPPVLTPGRSRSAAPGAAQPRRARRFRPPPRAPDVRTARRGGGRGFRRAATRLAGGGEGVAGEEEEEEKPRPPLPARLRYQRWSRLGDGARSRRRSSADTQWDSETPRRRCWPRSRRCCVLAVPCGSRICGAEHAWRGRAGVLSAPCGRCRGNPPYPGVQAHAAHPELPTGSAQGRRPRLNPPLPAFGRNPPVPARHRLRRDRGAPARRATPPSRAYRRSSTASRACRRSCPAPPVPAAAPAQPLPCLPPLQPSPSRACRRSCPAPPVPAAAPAQPPVPAAAPAQPLPCLPPLLPSLPCLPPLQPSLPCLPPLLPSPARACRRSCPAPPVPAAAPAQPLPCLPPLLPSLPCLPPLLPSLRSAPPLPAGPAAAPAPSGYTPRSSRRLPHRPPCPPPQQTPAASTPPLPGSSPRLPPPRDHLPLTRPPRRLPWSVSRSCRRSMSGRAASSTPQPPTSELLNGAAPPPPATTDVPAFRPQPQAQPRLPFPQLRHLPRPPAVRPPPAMVPTLPW
uniref:basic proline-rich protein-like n=1 Tax=Agelaius phoeniceus TaxID=39638 RepID=UPI0023EB67CE|nr:basic proline-rich protein-like [Agelaius phoeniceus]